MLGKCLIFCLNSGLVKNSSKVMQGCKLLGMKEKHTVWSSSPGSLYCSWDFWSLNEEFTPPYIAPIPEIQPSVQVLKRQWPNVFWIVDFSPWRRKNPILDFDQHTSVLSSSFFQFGLLLYTGLLADLQKANRELFLQKISFGKCGWQEIGGLCAAESLHGKYMCWIRKKMLKHKIHIADIKQEGLMKRNVAEKFKELVCRLKSSIWDYVFKNSRWHQLPWCVLGSAYSYLVKLEMCSIYLL